MAALPRTRSGRVPALPVRLFARNPLTNRLVVLDGPTWRRMRDGWIPGVVVVETTGAIGVDPTTYQFRVTQIHNPSPPPDFLDRDSVQPFPPEVQQHVRDVVRGVIPLDWDILLRGVEYDVWLHEHTAEVTIGPYIFRQDQALQGLPPPPGTREDPPPLFPLQDCRPWYLPFSNVSLNEAPDGNDNLCVQRILDSYGLKDLIRENPSIQDLMAYCAARAQPITIYDGWGQVWHTWDTDTPRSIYGISMPMHVIAMRGHLYPLHSGLPKFVDGPTRVYGEDPYTFMQMLTTKRIAIYRVDDRFLVGPNPHMPAGVYERMPPADAPPPAQMAPPGDPGMSMVFDCLRNIDEYPWLLSDVKLIKRLLLPLNLPSPLMPSTTQWQIFKSDYLSIDMSKCYYHVLECLAKDGIGVPDPFESAWKVPAIPCQYLTFDYTRERLLVLLEEAPVRFGIRTNLVSGEMYNLLRDMGATPVARKYMRLRVDPFRFMPRKDGVVHGRMMPDDAEKKTIGAFLTGMCGKVCENMSTIFGSDGMSEEEVEYYVKRYDFTDIGSLLMGNRQEYFAVNRLHVHLAVILTANYRVLEMMRRVQLLRPRCLPVRIRTDSLMYRKKDLKTPHRTAKQTLDLALVASPHEWHEEEVRDTVMFATPVRVEFPTSEFFFYYLRNRSFIGPPGTGKTTAALAEPHDLRATFSNRNARRINGMTMHALFSLVVGMRQLPDFTKVTGMRIVVDEAQCLNRYMWMLMRKAYHEYHTTWLLAMDQRQLAPVGEAPIPMESPMYGQVTRLTIDYRNDEAIQRARELAWDMMFTPPYYKSLSEGPITKVNIAYDNIQVDRINAFVASHFGIKFGDPALYIATKDVPSKGISNGSLFQRQGDSMYDAELERTVTVPMKTLLKFFKLALCTTVHKRIGTGVDPSEQLTIWGMEPGTTMQRDRHVLYTAVSRGYMYNQLVFRSTFNG